MQRAEPSARQALALQYPFHKGTRTATTSPTNDSSVSSTSATHPNADSNCTLLQGGALDNQNSPPLNVACSSRQDPSIHHLQSKHTSCQPSIPTNFIQQSIYPPSHHHAHPPRFYMTYRILFFSFPYLFTIWEFHHLTISTFCRSWIYLLLPTYFSLITSLFSFSYTYSAVHSTDSS
jgi:hypothetical protein